MMVRPAEILRPLLIELVLLLILSLSILIPCTLMLKRVYVIHLSVDKNSLADHAYALSPFKKSSLHPNDLHLLADLKNFTFLINSCRCSSKYSRNVNLTLNTYFEQFINGEASFEFLKDKIPPNMENDFIPNDDSNSVSIFMTIFIHSSPKNFE